MLTGRDPLRSVQLIYQLSLYDAIADAIPPDIKATSSGSRSHPDTGLKAATVLHTLLDPQDSKIPPLHPALLRYLVTDPSTRARLYLASFLLPYMSLTYTDKKKKVIPLVDAVIRETLKLGSQYHFLDGVPFLFGAIPTVPDLLRDYPSFEAATRRSSIGMFLRHRTMHSLNAGVHWSTAFLFSLVVQVSGVYDLASDSLDGQYRHRYLYPSLTSNQVERASSIINQYNAFASLVDELDLYGVGELRPILDVSDPNLTAYIF